MLSESEAPTFNVTHEIHHGHDLSVVWRVTFSNFGESVSNVYATSWRICGLPPMTSAKSYLQLEEGQGTLRTTMAESYKDISGIIICSVQARVKPGKADEFARLIALEQARANSYTEPGTLSFDAARFADKFVFWAKFRSGEAMETHLQNQSLSYQEFVGQCLIEEPTVLFFPADSISPPEHQQ